MGRVVSEIFIFSHNRTMIDQEFRIIENACKVRIVRVKKAQQTSGSDNSPHEYIVSLSRISEEIIKDEAHAQIEIKEITLGKRNEQRLSDDDNELEPKKLKINTP
jgi:hypothetical protein